MAYIDPKTGHRVLNADLASFYEQQATIGGAAKAARRNGRGPGFETREEKLERRAAQREERARRAALMDPDGRDIAVLSGRPGKRVAARAVALGD